MLPVWLMNKWTLRLGAVAALLLALWWYGHYREEQGKNKGQAEQLEKDSTDLKTARENLQSEIAQWQTLYAQAEARLNAARAREEVFKQELDRLSVARTTARAEVSVLQDPQLFGFLTSKLAIRHPDDAAPSFYPQELRELASCVVERPLCDEQVKALGGRVDSLAEQVKAHGEQVASLRGEVTSWKHYTVDILEPFAVKSYDVAQRFRRRSIFVKIFSFGLVKDRKLDLPPFEKIKQDRPN